MKAARRALRRGALILGALLLVLAAALGAAAVGLHTPPGLDLLAKLLESRLSAPGVMEVRIGRLSGTPFKRLTVSDVFVSDRQGDWLVAQQVTVDWRPLTLVRGWLEIDELRIVGPRIARRPVDAAEAAPGIPQWRPPAVRLGALAVENAVLEEPVLGVRAGFGLAGKAVVAADGVMELEFVVDRSDGVAGRARIEASFDPSRDRLRLVARISEPQGGLTARLLDLPQLPAVELDLSGDGFLSDWSGRVDVATGGTARLGADVRLWRALGYRYAAVGTAALAEFVPERLRPLVQGEIRFDASGEWIAGRRLTVSALRIGTPGLGVEAEGRLELAERAISARLNARTAAPSVLGNVFAGAAARSVVLTAEISGPLDRPNVQATVDVSNLLANGNEVEAFRFSATVRPTRRLTGSPLELDLEATGKIHGLRLADATLAGLVGGSIDWSADARVRPGEGLVTVRRLTARAAAAGIELSGSIALDGRVAEGSFRLQDYDLARASDAFGRELGGGLTAEGFLRTTDLGATLEGTIVATVASPSTGFAQLDALLGTAPVVATDFTLSEAETRLSRLVVDGRAGGLEAEARALDGGRTLDITYALRLQDPRPLNQVLGVEHLGGVTSAGRIWREGGQATAAGSFTLAEARLLRLGVRDIEGTFDVRNLLGLLEGSLSVDGETDLGALRARTSFAVAPDSRLQLQGAEATIGLATAKGDLTVPLDGGAIVGTLSGRMGDLRPWSRFAELDLAGAVTFSARLSDVDGTQAAALRLEASELVIGGAGARPLRFERLNAEVRARRLWDRPQGDARIEASGGRLASAEIERLDLALSGTPEAFGAQGTMVGLLGGPFSVTAGGRFTRLDDGTSLALDHVEGELAGLPFRMAKPTKAAWRTRSLEIEDLDLELADGRIEIGGRVDERQLDAKLAVHDLPLSLLRLAGFEPPLDGSANMDATLAGSPQAPVASFHVWSRGLRPSDADPAASLNLEFEASGGWRDRRLILAGRLAGLGQEPATFGVELPLALDPDALELSFAATESTSGSFAWQGELGPLWELLPFDEHRLTGHLDAEARLSGRLGDPRIAARLSLAEGEYEHLIGGTLLRGLRASATMDAGDRLRIEAEAEDGEGGQARLTGAIDIDADWELPGEAVLSLQDVILLRRDDVNAKASGNLSYQRRATGSSLTGRLETSVVEVRLVDRLPPSVIRLRMIEVGGEGPAQGGGPGDGAGEEVTLDLEVAMPRRVIVRGRGLDSEWMGRLHVAGTVLEPRVTGKLSLVRGTFALAGKTFVLRESAITFESPAPIDPVLDITAEHEARDLVATVRVSGPSSSPAIAIGSRPPLPQDEILARVLFGRSARDLSPVQALQIAESVASLTGAFGASEGPLERLRRQLGVDVLTVESDDKEAAGSALRLGKYVTERTYVGVKRGAAPGSGAVSVEVDVTPNIKIGSDLGEQGTSNIGVGVKWDY